MSKVDLLTLYPDQTHSLTRNKIVDDYVNVRKFKPKLIVGKSVFPERASGFWKRLGLKRRRRLVVWEYGAEFCRVLPQDVGKVDDHWNVAEAEKFINKVIAWAAAKAKLFSKMEIYVFWALLVANLVVTFLMLRRIGF